MSTPLTETQRKQFATPLTRPSLEDCTKKISLLSVIANEQCRLGEGKQGTKGFFDKHTGGHQLFIHGDGKACRDASRAVLKLSKNCLEFEPKN